MTHWIKRKLGDLITIKHGYAFKGEYFSDYPTNNILLTPGNFAIGGGFKSDKLKYYQGPVPQDYVLKNGDLTITMTDLSKEGDTLGYPAIVPHSYGLQYLHNQRIGLVVRKINDLDLKFLFYLMRTHPYQKFIVGSASGATVRHTSPKKIYDYETEIPGIQTQVGIASVLSAYDDLIENNGKHIKALEEIAQLLYTEWFVKFKFPGHEKVKMVESGTEYGMIPEGWEIVPMGAMASFVNGYPFKPKDLGDSGLPIIKIPELRSGILEKTPRNNGENIPEKYRIKNGDIIFSWSATLLVNIWNSGHALLNQHLFLVSPKLDFYRSFVFYALTRLVEKLSKHAVGATMQHLRRDTIVDAKMILPTEDVLKRYQNLAANLLEQIAILQKENQKLCKMRDLIITQLITGRKELN